MSELNEHGSCSCEEPPEVNVEPLGLGQVGADFRDACRWLADHHESVPLSVQRTVDAAGLLLAEVRRHRDETERWRSLTYRDEYVVYRPCSDGCDHEGSRKEFPSSKKALLAVETLGGAAQVRRHYTGPWRELLPPPF